MSTRMNDGHFPLEQPFQPKLTFWLILLALGVLIPLIGYGILPWLGVTAFSELFSINHIFLLSLLIGGGIVYALYLEQAVKRPQLLIYFMVVGWALVESWNEVLIGYAGINLHLRPILLMFLGVPAVWFLVLYGRELFTILPHFKYYVGFMVWLLFYFLFYNSHAVDLRGSMNGTWTAGSLGLLQFSAYLFSLIGIVLAAMAILGQSDIKGYFDRFNKILLISTSVLGLFTIAGYLGLPIGQFSQTLDGFYRADGIFSHPNPFSHHQGVLLIYLCGLFSYYQGSYKQRISAWLLTLGIAVNLVAFFIGLSKTAIAVFSVCLFLFFLLNLTSPRLRQSALKGLLVVLVILPIGIWLTQAITDQSFLAILQARLDEAKSYTWRKEIWDYLQSGIHGWWLVFGHGFTASNALVFQLTYNTQNNYQPLLLSHNGYLGLLYDLGIMGLLIFLGVISLMINTGIRFVKQSSSLGRPLLATILVLAVYFLSVSAFDEMTYMFDASQLFWIFTTLLYCMTLREGHP